ncbi:MAG: hypothetical protein ALECFALPRED_000108 [Alectoria fallacina]|uniref:Major facilitator superfamily (MFS) profile domain-containing protein n=1 Tax=Alectoria fallacina TaxID=1903189 RepID=A0A8H3I4K1_9LECA|nr:MAG: hypothetical protein ALECFALPRED_000108 [Alectoria fallacina]
MFYTSTFIPRENADSAVFKWIADKISRKYSIVVAVTIFTIGSDLQTASISYAMLVTARLIGGIGIGMLSMVAPLYISEISPPEIRGALLVLEELSIVTGFVVAFWITYGTRYMAGEWAWRLPFLLQLVPGLVLGLGILFLPFSPHWLVSKGRDAEALQALAKLRQLPTNDTRIQQEWFDIRVEVAFHKETSALRHPELQDRSVKSCFMTLSHLIIAILVGKFSSDWPGHRAAGWVSVTFLLFYMLSFGASWGPVPSAMPSEMFPSSLRAKGVALATCSNWLNNFIIGLNTPPIVINTGFGAYAFFAVFCLLSMIWTLYFVPETSGRTLEAMDHVFKDIISEQEEGGRKAIESEIIGSGSAGLMTRQEGEV